MTSLAKQLQRLTVPHTKAIYGEDKRKKSLLFDPKEAATLDKETFYSLGVNGLEELENIDRAFRDSSITSLFSESSLTFERSVFVEKVNKDLDEGISHFLIRLSPYCLLRPAHKAIEWLIYRYHVHIYNVDELVTCFLPFHESKIFVRVIQLLDLGSKIATKWDWLLSLQKSGVHLPRSVLVNHCRTDISFLSFFVCETLHRAIKVHTTGNKPVPQLRVLFSFYTTTVIGALETGTVTESLLSMLLVPISRGLKSKMAEYKAASHMILAQLLHKAKIKPSLLRTLMHAVTKHLTTECLKDAMMCLLLMFQTQTNTSLDRKTFRRMSCHAALADVLIGLSVSYGAETFIEAFVLRLVSETFRQRSASASGTDGSESESERVMPQYMLILHKIMHNINLEKSLAEEIARQVLKRYVQVASDHDEDVDDFVKLEKQTKSIVRVLEGRYSEAMDSVLVSIMSEMETGEEKEIINDFLNLSVVSVQHHLLSDSMTSLTLSLNHRLPTVRKQAIHYLFKNTEEVTESGFLKAAILSRIQDDSPLVVQSVLHSGKNLWQYFDEPEELLCRLLAILRKGGSKEHWHTSARLALKILCKCGSKIQEKVLELVLPYLFCRNSEYDFELRKMIVKSDLVQSNHLFAIVIREWPDIMKQKCSTSNILMAERLSEGLIKSGDFVTILQNWYQCCQSALQLQCLLLLVINALFPLVTDKEKKLSICLLQAQLLHDTMADTDVKQKIPDVYSAKSLEKAVESLCTSLTEKNGVPTDFTVVAIHHLINNIHLPDTLLKGSEFWQLNGVVANDICLKVMVKLFDLILEQTSRTQQNVFRKLLMQFTQTILQKTHILMRFFCMLWISHCSPEKCQLGISSALQARAVKLGLVYIQSLSNDDNVLRSILCTPDPVITSLFLLLSSQHQALRREAVDCFHYLHKLSSHFDSPFRVLLRRLSRCREELVADPIYLHQLLTNCFKLTSGVSDSEGEQQKSPGRHVKKMSHQEAKSQSLHKLLDVLVDEQTPLFVQKSLLEIISLINNPDVLCHLLSLMNHMVKVMIALPGNQIAGACLKLLIQRFNFETASLLTNKSTALDLLLKILNMEAVIDPDQRTVQQVAVEQIEKNLFGCLQQDVQFQIFTTLIGIWATAKTPEVLNMVRKVIKHLTLDAELIAMEIESCLKTPSAVTLREAKRRKKEVVEPVGVELENTTEFDTLPWLRCGVALEAIQNKKKLNNSSVLLPVCFKALARILGSEHHSSAENLKYMLLSVVHNVFMMFLAEDNPTGVVPEEMFNMELIVQCVRTSENPQTQHQSLLALTEAAKVYPEQILHKMMSVFTFMGASILRQDDAYSFDIIIRLLATVIPALIQACKQRKNVPKGVTNEVEDVITMVIRVFVDAYPHIPEHRQLMLFYKLMEILENGKHLWMVLLLLTEVMVTKGVFRVDLTSNKQGIMDLFPNLHFCLALSAQFQPSVVLTSAKTAVQYLADLPDVKGKVNVTRKRRQPQSFGNLQKEDTTIFSVDYHTDKQLRHFKYSASHLLVSIFTHKDFIAKLLEKEDIGLMVLFRDLIETVLKFITRLTKTAERYHTTPMAKFWKSFLHKICELLDKIVSLLPDQIFLEVVSGLMGHQLSNIQRKAMELLNTKLLEKRKLDESEEQLLIPLVEHLTEIVKKMANESKGSDDGSVNCQTALYSLKLLCRLLGSRRPQLFVEVLKISTKVFSKRQDIPQLAACALLCIAEICHTVKVHVIPHLSLFMPSVIKTMNNKEYLLGNELFLLSTVAAIQKVSENLIHFLSPYLLDVMTHICGLSAPEPEVEILQKPQIQLKLKTIRHILATALQPRVVLPVVTECYYRIVQDDVKSIEPLMSLLSEHIVNMDKEDLMSHLKDLQSFFMKALDFRAKHSEFPEKEVSAIESNVINTVIALVMKLSEATFQPMLLKLYNWATQTNKPEDRVLVFYRLADSLAGKLRSLFTLFAGHIVQHAANVLKDNNSAEGDRSLFKSSDVGEQKICCLLSYVLDCLYKCFLHDTERFVGKERFDSLMQPLVDQLENMFGGNDVYKERVSCHLIPCIVEFAVDAQESSLWQTLNYQILLKTRHTAAMVRYAALETIDELHRKLGEDYIFLLPETIPFLAELMEDESEEVENKCQSVVSEMEKTLGEPLQKYF